MNEVEEQEAQFAINRARSDVMNAEEDYHQHLQAADRAKEAVRTAFIAFESAVRHHEAIRQQRFQGEPPTFDDLMGDGG